MVKLGFSLKGKLGNLYESCLVVFVFSDWLRLFHRIKRTILLSRNHFQRVLQRHEMYLAELFYLAGTSLHLFECGHLLEHDLLLLSAAVLMGALNLLINLSIFIIS